MAVLHRLYCICVHGDQNQFEIGLPLFGAASAATNKGTIIFYANFSTSVSVISKFGKLNFKV